MPTQLAESPSNPVQPISAPRRWAGALLALLMTAAAAWPTGALAVANYVYHERTGNDPGCGGQYVNLLTPNRGQAVTIRFKVEYQFDTDRARLYYTTDGSSPSGAFGVPAGSTAASVAAFQCTFGGPVVDVWEAIIPAQPAGTTVKYIIGAWKDLMGDEIFANSGNINSSTLATVFNYAVATGSATDLYWDANGVTAGAGGPSPAGIWGVDAFWNAFLLGDASTEAWTPGRNAFFSAGTDATGTFNLGISGSQSVGGINVQEGNITFTNGTLVLAGSGAVVIANGSSLTMSNVISGTAGLNKSGAGALTLAGNNLYSGNTLVNEGVLAINAETNFGAAPAVFTQNAVTLFDSTTLRLAAPVIPTFSATRGLTIAGSGANLDVVAGGILFIPVVVDGPGATVTKTGAGEVGFYGAANTFSKLIIDQGNLRIGQAAFAGSDLSYGALPAVFTPDAITIRNGATNRVVGSAAVVIHTNRGITLGTGGGVLRNDVSPVSLTINSVISGPGGLRKEGGQALNLNGNNAYLGNTAVNAGTTTLNGANNASGSVAVHGNATLTINNGNTFAGVTIGNGRINANTNFCLGAGSVTLAPTGAVNVLLINATALGTGPLTNVALNNPIVFNTGLGTIDIGANSGRELNLHGHVSGTGSVIKNNGGSTGALGFHNPADRKSVV